LEQTVAKNKTLSKSLLRYFLKRRNQTYTIAGNTAHTWRKTSLKKRKTNQTMKKQTKKINYKPNRKKISQMTAK